MRGTVLYRASSYYCDQPSSFSQAPSACGVQCSTERLVFFFVCHVSILSVLVFPCFTKAGLNSSYCNAFRPKYLCLFKISYINKLADFTWHTHTHTHTHVCTHISVHVATCTKQTHTVTIIFLEVTHQN